MWGALVPTKDFSFGETFIFYTRRSADALILAHLTSNTVHRNNGEQKRRKKMHNLQRRLMTDCQDQSFHRAVRTLYYSTELDVNAIALRWRSLLQSLPVLLTISQATNTHTYIEGERKRVRATFILCHRLRHGNDEMTNNVSIFSVSLPIIPVLVRFVFFSFFLLFLFFLVSA